MSTSPLTVLVVAKRQDPALKVLEGGPEGVEFHVAETAEEVQAEAGRADVLFLCNGTRSMYEHAWKDMGRLKWVHSRSAGVDHLLFPDFVASDVPLSNARGCFSASLAEWAIFSMMYFAKDLPRFMKCKADKTWDPFVITEIRSQTLGIVGCGSIGLETARRAKAFGMAVLATNRTVPASGDPAVDKYYATEELKDMLAVSDFVLVAAPLTLKTRGLMGEAEFSTMKPTAVVMNVGRGPVIDEAALVHALTTNVIRGAALDVYEVEPLPKEHPLFALDNVLLSFHNADNTTHFLQDSTRFFLENLERFLAGEPVHNLINKGDHVSSRSM